MVLLSVADCNAEIYILRTVQQYNECIFLSGGDVTIYVLYICPVDTCIRLYMPRDIPPPVMCGIYIWDVLWNQAGLVDCSSYLCTVKSTYL